MAVLAINTNGTVLGIYVDDVTGNSQVFLRAAGGTFTTFELPGGPVFLFSPFFINARGEVVGSYFNNTEFALVNFLRTAKGTITTITVPGGFVTPSGINDSGAIAGDACTFVGFNEVCHGFLQTSNGAVTIFDPPGSTFTNSASINSGGTITGDYIDANFASQGFVFANH